MIRLHIVLHSVVTQDYGTAAATTKNSGISVKSAATTDLLGGDGLTASIQ
jgi:hypothetical protein